MKIKKITDAPIVVLMLVVGVISLLVYLWDNESDTRREKFEGAWLIENDGTKIFTFSSITSNKGFNTTYYIRIIDPETGKIVHSNSFGFKYNYSVQLICYTKTSLWVRNEDQFTCFDFPSLKKRWNNTNFYEEIKKTHSEIGEPYSCKMIGGQFEVTNKSGKTFLLGIGEFENPQSPVILFFDESNQLGKNTYYPTPETKFIQNEGITIEMDEVDEKKKYHWEMMNIHDKLLADTGYARNYAVFSPDSSCYYFDRNHSRIAKKLVNDSLELIWKPAFDNREWLEGDFLRPYKGYDRLPENRLMTTNDTYTAFIHYWTSLDKKENKLKLAGVDLKTGKVIWDIDLTSAKIKDGCRPQQTDVIGNTLIILWREAGYYGTIMGIEAQTGEIKWVVRK